MSGPQSQSSCARCHVPSLSVTSASPSSSKEQPFHEPENMATGAFVCSREEGAECPPTILVGASADSSPFAFDGFFAARRTLLWALSAITAPEEGSCDRHRGLGARLSPPVGLHLALFGLGSSSA